MEARASAIRPDAPVCRCCLTEGCYKDIGNEYYWMGKREVYEEMLLETFNVNISFANSNNPKSTARLICEPCVSRLRDACDFKKQVLECERVFQQHLSNSGGLVVVDVQEIKGSEVKVEVIKKEKEEKSDSDDDGSDNAGFPDDDDDDDNDEGDEKPLTAFATKKEPNKETTKYVPEKQQIVKTEKRKSTAKVKVTPAKKVKKGEPKPSASKAKPKVTKPAAEKRKRGVYKDGLPVQVTKNAALILRHSTAYPFSLYRTSLQCYCCEEKFEDPKLFRMHTDRAHSKADKSFSVLKFCLKGRLLRIDITNLKCKICRDDATFPSLNSLVDHLKNKHQVAFELNHDLGCVPMKLDKSKFQCLVCDKTFSRLMTLYRHSGTHYCKEMCEACGKNFETVRGLELHALKCKASSNHFCIRCKTSFNTAEELRVHKRTNERCMPVVCRQCNKRFLSRDYLEKHLQDTHGEAKIFFPCVECEQTFDKRIFLYRHFKKCHTNDYICSVCSRKFSTNAELRKHANIHLAEKPLKCNVCDQGFTRIHHLKVHLITHDDSLKTPCPVCGRLFTTKGKVKDHVLKHHPERDVMYSH